MSFSYRTYVGPYVRCAVETAEISKERRACTNTACENHQREIWGAAFCYRCGSAIGTVLYTEQSDAVDAWTVTEMLHERLSDADGDGYLRWSKREHAHIWVPNVAVPGRDYWLEEEVAFSLVEITAEQVLEERAAFTVQFQQELAILRETYGAGAVTVHWGIVQDYL